MLDLFDPGKILIVAIVALLVIGPKDLPRVLRTVGQVVGKMRRMAAEFQGQFMEALKEAELDDVKKELTAIGESARIDGSFDPTTLMRDEVTASLDAPKAHSESVVDIVKPTAEAAPEIPQAAEPAAPGAAPPPVDSRQTLADASETPLARGHQG
jgi:sec-independent protein translocase protein TatB